MKSSTLVAGLAGVGAVSAGASVCDTYTKALLGSNTPQNQQKLLTLVVNTAVIGNYTTPNVGIAVPGILTPGVYNGEKVNLLPYFDGGLDSTNMGGSCGVSVNFLDGGGAAPLMKNLPADNTSSNQYTLLTHLYEFFGYLLGCSAFGSTYVPYAGDTSMYDVHKFMTLDSNQLGYFIMNVGLSAASFGVAQSDVDAVGTALMDLFGYRCEPPAAIPSTAPAELQSICTDCECPVASSPDCNAYGPIIQPAKAGSKHPCSWKDYEHCPTGWGGGHGGHGGHWH